MQRVFWLSLSLLFACQVARAEILKKIELTAPFLCQAPNGDWSQPWQDACEEAAIVIAIHYAKDFPLDKETGNQEILGLVNYQNKRWGGHHDLTAKRAAALMREYFKFEKYRVINSASIEGIKQELSAGNIVLTPMAGRMLGNRYYRRPGPLYHYLVFTGYDEHRGEFITNDPGTKRGKGYRYKYAVAYNAIHDWTGSKETIAQGKKAMIVIYK